MNDEIVLQGMTSLSLLDPDLKQAFDELGPPAIQDRPHGFEAFLLAIVSQQLSTKVATVIMARVVALMDKVTPEHLLEISDQDLRDAGLSWRKVEYAKGLAKAVHDGSFDIEGLEKLSDEEAVKAITALKGFGRWSAEIYLMFSLNRQDIFPADDLGLLIGLENLKGLSKRPTPKEARDMVSHWSPWRSVGAFFLWDYYHRNDPSRK